MAKPAYRTAHYQNTRRRLLGQPCIHCGWPATTADHIPALALHHHQEGTHCCTLMPACHHCNSQRGARLGRAIQQRRRTLTTTARPSRQW